MSFTKYILAGLASAASISALPQQSSMATSYTNSNATVSRITAKSISVPTTALGGSLPSKPAGLVKAAFNDDSSVGKNETLSGIYVSVSSTDATVEKSTGGPSINGKFGAEGGEPSDDGGRPSADGPSSGGPPNGRPSGRPSANHPSPPTLPSVSAAAAAASNAALAKKVLADVTNVNRFNELLTVDGLGAQILSPESLRDRVVFDFNQKLAPLGDGGLFVLANENNFPILVEQGISTAVAVLNPCSMNSPHTHPRANEWLTVVDGTIEAGFMLENGFLANPVTGALTTQISTNLSSFQGTIFPMGSIHFQFNPTCEPATFIATLNSADPGTSQVAQNFFFLDDRVVDIALGERININGQNIAEFRNTLPPNLVQAMDTCLQRCGR